MSAFRSLLCLSLAFALAGCPGTDTGEDASTRDAGRKRDASLPVDAEVGPLPDTGTQPGPDSGTDAGTAAGEDASAPVDVGTPDTGPAPDTGDWSPCLPATGTGTTATNEFVDGTEKASVTVSGTCPRTFTLTTNVALRDSAPQTRTVVEVAGRPNVRTRNDMFDALYALALADAKEDSVEAIQDGAFNNGKAISCPAGGCFETGRKWNYVWTRDTAYATALGLASFDPTRARNSLEFKLSPRRDGTNLQIVQDTGTGGSYPVSSDRVTWAMGAWELLKYLDGAERTAFRDRAYEAIANTLEHDRVVVYDSADGLYTGEQSFLDWREQTYPVSTATDPVQIAMSKALSTNIAHLAAMEVASALAKERGDATAESRYAGWATALRTAIRSRFYVAADKLFGTFIPGRLDPAVNRRFDVLSSAFTVLYDVAEPAAAAEVLARYPHAGKGPPTVWPQQQFIAIYHNRSFWPFTTAFWLRAAQKARNDAAADFAVRSLMRGAALNLSNMENFELMSGKAYVDDGSFSGPVVNSQRQLWSVGGYLGMVQSVVFGLDPSQTGLRLRPYVTRAMRHDLFGNADTLVLNDFPYRGKRLTVVVRLPAKAASREGAYAVGAVTLNGQPVTGEVASSALPALARFEVTLLDTPEAGATITRVEGADWRALFAPKTPAITSTAEDAGAVRLTLDAGGEAGPDVAFDVYRDGVLVQSALAGGTTSWRDVGATDFAHRTYCWSVETRFVSSGNRSHRSGPRCHWCSTCVKSVAANDASFQHSGGELIQNHGRWHIQNWGAAGQTVEAPFTVSKGGNFLVQVVAGNGAGPLNTGITCGVKVVSVVESSSGTEVARGVVAMPQLGDWSVWKDSSFVPAKLEAGKTYKVRLVDGAAAANMSSFKHFEAYTGGQGGSGGEFHFVNVAELKLLQLDGF